MISTFAEAQEGRGVMSKGRHTEAEMIGALKQMEAGRRAEDVTCDCISLSIRL